MEKMAPANEELLGNSQVQILLKLTKLETKLDNVISLLQKQDEAISNLRMRVEELEKTRAKANGALAVVVACGGAVGSLLTMIVKYFSG